MERMTGVTADDVTEGVITTGGVTNTTLGDVATEIIEDMACCEEEVVVGELDQRTGLFYVRPLSSESDTGCIVEGASTPDRTSERATVDAQLPGETDRTSERVTVDAQLAGEADRTSERVTVNSQLAGEADRTSERVTVNSQLAGEADRTSERVTLGAQLPGEADRTSERVTLGAQLPREADRTSERVTLGAQLPREADRTSERATVDSQLPGEECRRSELTRQDVCVEEPQTDVVELLMPSSSTSLLHMESTLTSLMEQVATPGSIDMLESELSAAHLTCSEGLLHPALSHTHVTPSDSRCIPASISAEQASSTQLVSILSPSISHMRQENQPVARHVVHSGLKLFFFPLSQCHTLLWLCFI